jgi:glycine hydroxymethyltransferase
MFDCLHAADSEVYACVGSEIARQQDDLELIASENYCSRAVMEAMGSPLTNKYAEGLPNRRYYGGCEHVDVVENIARKRARQLFMVEGCDIGVNVQPHAGAQANSAAFLSILDAGDTFMGLDLSHGGHLTHGSPVNSSGKLYRAVHYHLGDDGRIDMNRVAEKARAERPRLIVCGASAYPRIIDFEAFRAVADEVGAVLMADIAHIAGLVAVGLHPSPFPHCHVVTTTTHKTLRGPRGGLIMAHRERMRSINSAVFPGTQGGPLMHVIAAKAVAFGEALQSDFASYQQQVLDNAKAMAEALLERGYPLVSGGTDNHLLLIDLRQAPISGKDAEAALGAAGITVNKNTVPGETRSPMVTSGVRIGTPAMTTRGMGTSESRQVGAWIADILDASQDETLRARVSAGIHELCTRYPVYPELSGERAGRAIGS